LLARLEAKTDVKLKEMSEEMKSGQQKWDPFLMPE
jgi:hypothetical protein